MSNVHFASSKLDWGTPASVYDPLDDEFKFGLDVACTQENCKTEIGLYWGDKKLPGDGLKAEWNQWGVNCWMNPPYGRELVKWIQKAWDEKQKGVTTVCLVPSRTDTKWWAIFWDHAMHKPWDPRDEVRFIKGRIKFEGAEHGAPFPSAIIVLRGAVEKVWCSRCSHTVYTDAHRTCPWGRACGLNQPLFED